MSIAIVVFKDNIYQLTWTSNIVYVYDIKNIEKPIKGKVILEKKDGKESIKAKFDVNLYDHEIRPKFLGITVTEKAEIDIQSTPLKVE